MTGRLQRRLLVIASATLVLAVALSLHFFVQPLRPWSDQGWMLQAAIRHARGYGLTTQMGAPLTDLTSPDHVRLTYFPPFYPLAVSALLQTGLGVENAVKLVNLFAMIAGVLGWVALASRTLKLPSVRWMFAFLLVIAGAATAPKGGTADYLYWAAMGWWTLAIVETRRALAADEIRRAAWTILAAALIVAAMIGVRWAAVVLVPAGGLAIAIPDRGWRPDRRRLLAAIGFAIPGAATYFAITIVNGLLASSGSSLQSMKTGWHLELLATTYPLQSIFGIPLGIQPVLDRVWRVLDGPMTSPLFGFFFRVVLPVAAIVAIIVLVRPSKNESEDTGARGFQFVAPLTLVVWIAFLAFMTVRYNWGFVNWSYLDEPRYFRPVWPLAALVWLALVERLGQQVRRAILVVLIVCGLYSLQAMIRWEHQWLTEHDESLELVEKVESLAGDPRLHVVVDIDPSDYVIRPSPNVVALGYPNPETVNDLAVGRAAELWLVRRVHQKTAYIKDPDYDAKRFYAMRARFRPELAWTSSAGSYEMWHARIGEGDAEQ